MEEKNLLTSSSFIGGMEQSDFAMNKEELTRVTGTASFNEENAEVESPNADKGGELQESGTGNKTIVMQKLVLEEDKVYHMKDIGAENLPLNYIRSNRKEKKQIDNKLKTCEEADMQVPAILTDSIVVQESGYPQADILTDNELKTSEEIFKGYTLCEGNNRFRAYLKALEKAKNDQSYIPFDFIFIYKKYPDANTFRQAYHNMNLYNVPTKTKDFVNDVLATSSLPVLEEYKRKIAAGLTAKASGYASIGKEITKRDMVNIFNGKTPSDISSTEILNITNPIYDAVMQAFSSEKKAKSIVKGTSIWSYNAKKLIKSSDKRSESKKLVKLYSELDARTCSKLMDVKAENGRTKEQVIHEILEKRYITL